MSFANDLTAIAACLALACMVGSCRLTVTAQTRDNVEAYGAAGTDGAVCAVGSYAIATWDPLSPKPTPDAGGHP